jgi:hypothetical protein
VTVPVSPVAPTTGKANAIGGLDVPSLDAFPPPNDPFSIEGDLRLSESEDDLDHDGDGILTGAEIAAGTDPLLPDTDGDGLDDGEENALGTNPLLADTDGDGLLDGDEIGYPSDPLLADTDGDGLLDGADNCPHVPGDDPFDGDADDIGDSCDNCPVTPNRAQTDQGGLASVVPDGVGDLCQNADFNGDGVVDILDVTLLRRALIGLEPALDPSMPPAP